MAKLTSRYTAWRLPNGRPNFDTLQEQIASTVLRVVSKWSYGHDHLRPFNLLFSGLTNRRISGGSHTTVKCGSLLCYSTTLLSPLCRYLTTLTKKPKTVRLQSSHLQQYDIHCLSLISVDRLDYLIPESTKLSHDPWRICLTVVAFLSSPEAQLWPFCPPEHP
jgi:hypothetical protein